LPWALSSGSDGCSAHEPRLANTLRFLMNIPSAPPSSLLIHARRQNPLGGCARLPCVAIRPATSGLGRRGLLARNQQSCWIFCPERNPPSQCRSIKLRPRQLVALFGACPQSQRSILAHQDFGLGFRSLDDCSIRRLDEIGPSLLIRLSRHHCEFYLARVIPACSAPHFFRGAGRIVVLVRPDSGHLGSHRPDPDVACGSPS
jgi:hypothetical protein